MAKIYLVKNSSIDPDYDIILGAFQDPDFAQAYINEIREKVYDYDKIITNFNRTQYDQEENELPGAQEHFETNIQPQLDEINKSLADLIIPRCSKISIKQWGIDENSFMYDEFSNILSNFYIDEIEVASPLYEKKLNEGMEIRNLFGKHKLGRNR